MIILVRSEEKNDYEAIRKINDLAFNQINEGVMIKKLRDNPDFIAELSLVAVVDNEVVGHILFFPIKIKNNSEIAISLSLGPIAIHPNFQNKGIGSKLVVEGLKKAKKLGFTSVIVLGHPNYYPRFGFQPASKWKIRLQMDVPDEAFMAVELKQDSLNKCSGIVEYPNEFLDAM
jgi:putative acetyltransferase